VKSSANNPSAFSEERLDAMIHEIRGQRVMLDTDLARVYGVPTFRFNEAVKRNRNRFPPDFMFQLSGEEFDSLRSQIAMPKLEDSSQIAMSSRKHRGSAYRPYAFTEHGALQAANVLRSKRAVQMSIFVIRAFVKMRETLLSTGELARKLAALEKQLTGRLDTHEVAIVHVLQDLMLILNPPPDPPPPARPKIGFSHK
jgi:ORF6N domain-containing protein